MNLVRLYIKRITYSHSQNADAFVLILHDLETDLKLPIIIGAFEAQAIALELEKKLIPPRPLTHDLFKSFGDSFGIKVVRVVIHRLSEGVFHCNMVCEQNGGEEHIIDARTSDAIAIALRFNAPIFTYRHILQRAGIHIPNASEISKPTVSPKLDYEEEPVMEKNRLSKHSLPELKELLEDCVANEDYELAAQIRDEITKRENL